MKKNRNESLLPVVDGITTPKYIRLYDNSKTGDNYTVVFTGRYAGSRGQCNYVGFNAVPHSPNMGIWQHGGSNHPIDRPKYSHLGKPIKFSDLNKDCQNLILSEYKELWNIK